ncbi:MAG: hypothetical protein J6Y82_03675 [Bacteroidales bacterium]|nr:hypothetical protein [Bacteroidales bacterium]
MPPEQFTECTAAIHVEIEHALNKTIPMRVANLAVKLFKENFQKESFFGQKWPDVRRRTHPPKRTKYPADRQRKILNIICFIVLIISAKLQIILLFSKCFNPKSLLFSKCFNPKPLLFSKCFCPKSLLFSKCFELTAEN